MISVVLQAPPLISVSPRVLFLPRTLFLTGKAEVFMGKFSRISKAPAWFLALFFSPVSSEFLCPLGLCSTCDLKMEQRGLFVPRRFSDLLYYRDFCLLRFGISSFWG